LARRGWEGEKAGLSEQPAGLSTSVSDLGRGVVSGVVIQFVNTLLDTRNQQLLINLRGIFRNSPIGGSRTDSHLVFLVCLVYLVRGSILSF
jgi:hypothetical protein